MSFPSVASHLRFKVAPFLAIAAGSICFLLPALINGFPFVFPDSVDYLIFTPRLYRSPFYGLFIFFFHLNRFIWAPVIAQAFIASHLVWVLIRIHAGGSSVRYFGFMVIILVSFSSLPFFVGFIMADFFTPIMILVFYILGFHLSALSRLEKLYFILLGCVAVAAHISHLIQALALVSVIIIIHVFLRTPFRVALTRSTILSIPLVLSAIAILLYNIVVHHSLALFPAGQSFLLANMIEQGPARRYLQETCPAVGYRICSIIDSMPKTSYEVLWAPDAAYQNLGGFEGMREEAEQIVMSTFRSRPWDVLQMAAHTVGLSFVTHAPGAELHPYGESMDIWMVNVLTKKFGLSTVRAYEDSLQSQDALPRALLQAVDSISFPIATVGLLISGIFAFRRGFQEAIALAILIPAAYAINNTLSAFGSGVFDRYQARVTWLFSLAAMLIIIQLIESSPNKSLSGRVRPGGGNATQGASEVGKDLHTMQSATVNLFRRRSADRGKLLGT
jgi:hypothetical protein